MHQTVNLSDVGSTPTLCVLALSSNGLGQRIFVPFIGVRIPVGSLEIWQSGLMHRFTKPATNYRSVGSNPTISVSPFSIRI